MKKLIRAIERIEESSAENPHLVAVSIILSSIFGAVFFFVVAFAWLMDK